MPSVLQHPPRRRPPVHRWARRLAIWLVVLGAMSVGTCRRRDERVIARSPATRGPGGPAAPMVPTVVGAGPAVRHAIMPHVVGVQPRASRRSDRRLARTTRRGKLGSAVELYDEAVTSFRIQTADVALAITLAAVAQVRAELGDPARALDQLAEAKTLVTRALGPAHPDVAAVWIAEMEPLTLLNRHDEAIAAGRSRPRSTALRSPSS